MSWKKETRKILDKIAEYLLRSDFEEAEEEAAKYLAAHEEHSAVYPGGA